MMQMGFFMVGILQGGNMVSMVIHERVGVNDCIGFTGGEHLAEIWDNAPHRELRHGASHHIGCATFIHVGRRSRTSCRLTMTQPLAARPVTRSSTMARSIANSALASLLVGTRLGCKRRCFC